MMQVDQTLFIRTYSGIERTLVFKSYRDAHNWRETWKENEGQYLPMNPHNGFVYSADIVPGLYVEQNA